ncbi:MAG TPA: hypothetical protein VF412_18155 [Bdellovibrio sp.]|uniref:hypothetical protein n=1 Tax=Bdellovibrio sp. TaxID=28201 RepID=UPI002F21D7EF
MRVLLFVLTFVSTTWAGAVQPVAGVIIRTGQDILLQSDDTACASYRIETKSADAQSALQKLAPGDTITATGLIDKSVCTASIESIDYVGLKRMLGNWFSKDGLITVRDFTNLQFFPTGNTEISKNYDIVKPIEYKYSLTPSDGKEWVLFLSDNQSTTFATIQFSKDIAIMKIFDSDSGEVKKTMILNRRGTSN